MKWILVCICVTLLCIVVVIIFAAKNTMNVYWRKVSNFVMKNTDIIKNCELYTGKKLYRLGDMVRMSEKREEPSGEKYHTEHFPESIAVKYMKETKKPNNYKVLAKITKEHAIDNNIQLEGDNTLVIHLRTGDVVEENPNDMIDILSYQSRSYGMEPWSEYVPPLYKIKSMLDNYKDINTVVLVSGSHIDINNESRSCQYISYIKKYIETLGYEVKLRFGHDPDDDFAYMCIAKNFTSSHGGGYSKLIHSCREYL